MSGFICTIFRFMSARLVQNVGGIFFFPQAGRSLLRLGQNCQDCFSCRQSASWMFRVVPNGCWLLSNSMRLS